MAEAYSLETLFHEAGTRQASDLHLVVGKPPIIRLHGELLALDYAVVTAKKIQELISAILLPAQRDELMRQRDLDLSYQAKDGTRFRVNLHFEKDNLGLAARVIPTKIPSLDDIGMP